MSIPPSMSRVEDGTPSPHSLRHGGTNHGTTPYNAAQHIPAQHGTARHNVAEHVTACRQCPQRRLGAVRQCSNPPNRVRSAKPPPPPPEHLQRQGGHGGSEADPPLGDEC